VRGRPDEMCPSRPRRFARAPDERRATGTGQSSRAPEITANSNRPRTAAIRWFIVDAATPRPDRRATTVPDGFGVDNQSRKSNTSIAVTEARANSRSEQNRKKLNTWNAYDRTVNGENARTSKCDR
jgi:hypothetical protein